MAKFIFSFGIIDIKSFLPLIYAISYICLNIYKNYGLKDSDLATSYLFNFGISIGQVSTYFIGRIIKYKSKTTEKNKRPFVHYLKDYLILFVISTFFMIEQVFDYASQSNSEKGEEKKKDYSREIFFIYGIEIIILTIVTYFWLRYSYHIHHLLSTFIIVIESFIVDALLNNYYHLYFFTILGSIINILADICIYTYAKYLMEHKYYFNMDILFIYGIFNTIVYFLSLIIIILIQNANDSNILLFQFFEFYKKNGATQMVIVFLIGLFVVGICFNMLEFLIVERLTPTYVMIGYEIGLLPTAIAIAIKDGINYFQVIIMFIIQFISLFFYLEILECNFCSLNKNTRKQIYERVEFQFRHMTDSTITFRGYDISENIKLQEIELFRLEKDDVSEKEVII